MQFSLVGRLTGRRNTEQCDQIDLQVLQLVFSYKIIHLQTMIMVGLAGLEPSTH